MSSDKLPCAMRHCVKPTCAVPYCSNIVTEGLTPDRFEFMKGEINKEIRFIMDSLMKVMLKLFICRDKKEFVKIRDCLNSIKLNLAELKI